MSHGSRLLLSVHLSPVDLGILGLGDATEIGIGGSATVYSARRSGSDDDVAVKVLNVADPVFVERFEREGQMLTTLSRSPRIVTVHEAGTTDAGRPYLVLDLCTSSLLDRINREEKLDPLEACRVLADVCEAVADAHLIGVVHRDIKPANILQSANGDYLVADFGISTVLGSTTTETVSTSFTAGYVAPETLGGERAGAPADIYALGATLFHMVTGSAPFTSAEGEANIFALANRVANEDLPDLRLEGVPGVVCDLIELATAKNPDERPTAIDLRSMLLDVASGAVTDAGAEDQADAAGGRPPKKPAIARLIEAPQLPAYERLELLDRHNGASVFTGFPVADADVRGDAGSDLETRQQAISVRVFDTREFDPVARKTFRDERRTLAGLSGHARLVGLLDFGYTADGRPFDVEVDLGEETLEQSAPAFAWPRVVEVGIMLASALEVLHRGGLYHGYVTPSVLFIVEDGGVALGDYRAIASLGPAEADAAAEIDADLQSAGRTLLQLAGVAAPASGLALDWETAVAACDTLGDGPRSLRTLLVGMAADDTEVPPANAYQVAVQLQGLQAEVGISETPLLVDAPAASGPTNDTATQGAVNGSTPAATPVAEDGGIDPAWAPPAATTPLAGPNDANHVSDVAALAAATSEFSLDDILAGESGDDETAPTSATKPGLHSQATETAELSEVMAAYHAEQAQRAGADSMLGSMEVDSTVVGEASPREAAPREASVREAAPHDVITRFDPMGRRSRWSDLVDDVGVRGRSLLGVLVALAALAAMAVGIYMVSQREAGEVQTASEIEVDDDAAPAESDALTGVVPVVADLETDAAVARIENAGFTVSLSREFDPTVPRGLVVSSTPTAGDQVELGSTIGLVISRGSEPSCIGSTEPAVRRQLEDRDLTVAGVTRSFSESLDVDRVIRCVIYDDTESAIIVVSDGPRSTDEDG